MYDGNIGDSSRNPSGRINHRRKLEQSTFNSIRKVLPDQDIIRACREARYDYRNRMLAPIVTVLHMVLAAIWPEDSVNAGWHVLWSDTVFG